MNDNTESESADPDKPVVIYLARHSKTTSNAMNLMQGWSDFPLTQEGMEIARSFGRGLAGITFDAAWCGKLTRHYETARTALDYSDNRDVTIHIDPDLREDNFGSFEGRGLPETFQAIAEHFGYKTMDEAYDDLGDKLNIMWQDALYALDKENVLHTDLASEDRAESSAQVQHRMRNALYRIARTVAGQGGGNVLVVSSGTSIRQGLIAIDPAASMANLGNTACTRLVYRAGALSIDGPVGSMEYYERGRLG